jgi:O-antigen/teichoic acid export membrane protein
LTQTGAIQGLPVQAPFRLAAHSALYGLAGALGKVLALITVPILTRLLAPSEYGLADLASSLAAVLTLVAMFAGDIPAARLIGGTADTSTQRTVLSTYFWSTVTVALIAAAITLPLTGVVSGQLWSAPGHLLVALLAVALVPVSTAQASLVTVQRLRARPISFAVLETVDLLGQMTLAVLFAALGGGATGMVAGFVTGSTIGLLAAAYQTRDVIDAKPNIALGMAMFREGIAFLPAAIAFLIANYVSRALLVAQVGAGAVGLFALDIRLAGGIALITSAFAMAWGPYGLGLPNNSATARLFGKVIGAYAILATSAALFLGAIAPEFIGIFSGDAYVHGAEMLPGLLISAGMAGGFFVLLVAAGVSGRGPWVAYAALVGSGVQVVACAGLLPILGLQAVGISAALGQALAIVLLAGSLGPSLSRRWQAVSVMFAGGVGAVLLQVLNLAPSASLLVRMSIAAVCVAGGATAAFQILRQLTRK